MTAVKTTLAPEDFEEVCISIYRLSHCYPCQSEYCDQLCADFLKGLNLSPELLDNIFQHFIDVVADPDTVVSIQEKMGIPTREIDYELDYRHNFDISDTWSQRTADYRMKRIPLKDNEFCTKVDIAHLAASNPEIAERFPDLKPPADFDPWKIEGVRG